MPRRKTRRKKNEQNQFRSYYCNQCHQVKPCGWLTSSRYEDWHGSCCRCYYQWYQADYQKRCEFATNLAREKEEWLIKNQKLIILQNYSYCPQCGSYKVNDELLQQEGQIVCQRCYEEKIKKVKGPYEWCGYGFSYDFWRGFFRSRWKINLDEWLAKFRVHPIDFKCAEQWRTNPDHLPPHCGCLERRAQESAALTVSVWQRLTEEIKECSCLVSQKPRVDFYDIRNYGYTYCQQCDKKLDGAGKHGTTKNRNDPQFWGLKTEQRILCLECIKNVFFSQIRGEKRKTFHRYLQRGYV